MLEMRLHNNSLAVKYSDRTVIVDNTFCSKYNIQYDRYNLATIKVENNLKKNFKIITLKKNYIMYNEKNQAIIDNNIFDILNSFNIEEINQDLLDILYKLEFIVCE